MADDNKFKSGDTVQLKSGGPIMTVEKGAMYGGEFKLLCVWFEKTKRMQSTFTPDTLTAA